MGQSTDFTSDVADIVETLLTDHWAENAEFNGLEFNWQEFNAMVPADYIKFGNDWWDGYVSRQVHVLDISYVRSPLTNSWKKYAYNHLVAIHVFCRENAANKTEAEIQIQNEIERIITDNRLAVGQGISSATITPFEHIPEQDPQSQIWHSLAYVNLTYYKVDTS